MATPSKKAYQLPKDAVWFITGCSSGIGRALVEHIISSQTYGRVVATARNQDSLSYVADDDSPRVLKLALDVTTPTAIDAAVQKALERFGRIDVVVNNAGYSVMGDTEAISDEAARKMVDVNFWGAVDVTKRVLPVFREVNASAGGPAGGLIFNVSSMGGFVGYPSSAFYHASKFAMEGFTQSVAKELPYDWNIHLSLIEPGGVETSFASSLQVPDRHPAYESHPASATTAMLAIMQSAEARKHFSKAADVAAAIYGVANRGGEIPLRVPLGPDSWFEIAKEIEQLRGDIAAIKDVSLSVGNPEQLSMISAVNASGRQGRHD